MCIPFLYGVGADVAMVRGGLPPSDLLMLSARGCPPPKPQQLPQQPPPNPPPPKAFFSRTYHLYIPLVGVNVKVFSTALNDYIFPSSGQVVLRWHYYPSIRARPRILATTTNRLVDGPRAFVNAYGELHIRHGITIPNPPIPLIVTQFMYHDRRWIVAVYEVTFPPPPRMSMANTPDEYRRVFLNRRERFVMFCDTAFEGFGSFTYRRLTIYLSPTKAYIRYFSGDYPRYYYIQPTGNPAYCMLITPSS